MLRREQNKIEIGTPDSEIRCFTIVTMSIVIILLSKFRTVLIKITANFYMYNHQDYSKAMYKG